MTALLAESHFLFSNDPARSAITIVANYSGVDNFGFADCSTPAGCITFLSAVGLDSNSVDEQAATVTVQKCEYLAGTPSCPLIQLIRLLEDPTLTPEPTPFPTAVPTSLPTVAPTAMPTPSPTDPTNAPTPMPTNEPTNMPTPLPTSVCYFLLRSELNIVATFRGK